MVSVFDIEKLQSLLRDFHRLTGFRITVFDTEYRELVSYPEGVAPFCALVRSCREGGAACAACDQKACAEAKERRGTYIYHCHAGLTEAIRAVRVGDALVGYLLFGHIFSYSDFESGWEAIRRACAALPIEPKLLRQAVRQCPEADESYIQSAARILSAVASFVVLEQMAGLQHDTLPARLDAYLNRHYAEPLTVSALCEALGVGRTRLYKIADELYGCGLSQQLNKIRLEHARETLRERPELSIAEVGSLCGFSDYNYFIAVFSRAYGTAPGKYRRGALQSEDAPT